MTIWEIQKKSFALLDKPAQQRYLFAVAVQMSLGILDILGVAIAGAIGVLATSSVTKVPPSNLMTAFLEWLHLGKWSYEDIIAIACLVALIFFVLKTFLSLFFSRKSFKFLATQQSRLTSDLVTKVMKSEYAWLREHEPHKLSTAIIFGVQSAVTNSLGQFMLMISELALMILFLLILLFLNPIVAVFTIFYLAAVLLVLRRIIGKKVSEFNGIIGDMQIESQVALSSIFSLFREIRVFQRTKWFEDRLGKLSEKRARNFADDMWIQQVPKYTLEVALLLGVVGLLLAGTLLTNSEETSLILAIFLTAAGRLFPSLLRIQSTIFSLQSRQQYAQMAHDLIDDLDLWRRDSVKNLLQDDVSILVATKEVQNSSSLSDDLDSAILLELDNLSFRYPNAERDVLNNVTFQVSRGERLAIVGPSGGGKSTLCDILLGLLQPTSGSLKVEGSIASAWINENPGKVSYLPQEVSIIEGTFVENICLGIERDQIDWMAFHTAVSKAQLNDVIDQLSEGKETHLGVLGVSLSGGQKQRVGLARALYSVPDILIMDEATSALDAEIEFAVLNALKDLGQQTTLIMIAHRLSAIKSFPRIIYLEEGLILGDGELSQIRKQLPRFDSQLKISGF